MQATTPDLRVQVPADGAYAMQLPDEAIAFRCPGALVPPAEEWTPLAELRAQHLLPPARLRELQPRLLQARQQVASERDAQAKEADRVEAGFIDLPQQLLDEQRRLTDKSLLGRITKLGRRLRDEVDRFFVLGNGGATLGARALFSALRSRYHNDLPAKDRGGSPRVYFEGDHFDNDGLQELLDLIQVTCVDPELHEERWGAAVVSKSGTSLETAAAYRVLRRELAEYYGHSDRVRDLVVPVTGPGRLRELCRADGYADDALLPFPGDVGERFGVFTAGGLLPAVVLGLDVRALLLGAASMTRRFLESPFDHNPVLQMAAVNFLMTTDRHKPLRVLSLWSPKLESLGLWYEQLVTGSLGKQGGGPTPLTIIQPRDLATRGQHLHEGPRDKFITNVVVKNAQQQPIMMTMAERNEDELNTCNRKGYPDLLQAALRRSTQACTDAARPVAEIELPSLSEYALGQLMQLLMLATVVEAHLAGVNPYAHAGPDAYQREIKSVLA